MVDLNAPVTVSCLVDYLNCPEYTGETETDRFNERLQQVGKACVATAKLVSHSVERFFLALTAVLGSLDDCGQRRLLMLKVHVHEDCRELRGYVNALVNAKEGLAQVLVSGIHRHEFSKVIFCEHCGEKGSGLATIDDARRTVDDAYRDENLPFFADCQEMKLGFLISEGRLPAKGKHVAFGRIERFQRHYFHANLNLEEAFSTLKRFLAYRDAAALLPPLFIHSPVHLEGRDKSSVPEELQKDYWLTIAKLRLAFKSGEELSERNPEDVQKLETLIADLRRALLKDVSSEHCERSINSLTRWLTPVRETLVFKKAFALPMLELLQTIPDEPLNRTHLEVENERHLREELLSVGVKVDAHGIAMTKGGIKALLNIMLEGVLLAPSVGPLADGDPEIFAGPHGPYYLVLDTATMTSDYCSEKHHLAYVVPGERERYIAERVLCKAVEEGFISEGERRRINDKVVTYEAFLDLPIRDVLGNIDPSKIAGAMPHTACP